ncbi:hypothetical protein ARAM_004138 [Aspergillus rambellii]|uniref:Uncharacterized protein n=1 Tax=Aspergillus rambellii TaxID=308745 RepID=A0A0F8UIE6_9EURO|nr:hypothetical protein ARAM_004138 [Aspergillus rambellii]
MMNLRISLESSLTQVKCVPNSQLQLLYSRNTEIDVTGTFSERLSSNEDDPDHPRTGDFPQSPLFAFSPLVSENNNDTVSPPYTEGSSNDVCAEHMDPTRESSFCGTNTEYESAQDTNEPPSQLASRNSVSPSCSAFSCAAEDIARPQKRSATDADLDDFESDSEVIKSKDVHENIASNKRNDETPVKSPWRSSKLPVLSASKSKHTHKPSPVPRPMHNLEITTENSEQSNIEMAPTTLTYSTPCISKVCSPQLLSVELEEALKTESEQAGTETDMWRYETLTTTSVLETPMSPHSMPDIAESKPVEKPEMIIVDDYLVLHCAKNLPPGVFKITITASIFIPYGNQTGWSDIQIQGLPRTGGGNSGILLFLMPDDHGLEIRTTNLKRSKIVENCLIAEFASPGDLIIPVRRCDKKFYGVVKDYTVDQEIRAHNVLSPARNEITLTRYDALCSLRLHDRCIWAESCCVFLFLDGGPEGSFRSELGLERDGLKMIHLTGGDDAAIGVSRVQVTCSPKDLEIFCVSWVTNAPSRGLACWLPRIHSVSSNACERSRDHLRRALTEIIADNSSQSSELGTDYDMAVEENEASSLEQILEEKEAENTPGNPGWEPHVQKRQDHRALPLEMESGRVNFARFIEPLLVLVVCFAVLACTLKVSLHSDDGCLVYSNSSMTAPLPLSTQVSKEVISGRAESDWYAFTGLFHLFHQNSDNHDPGSVPFFGKLMYRHSDGEAADEKEGSFGENDKQTIETEEETDQPSSTHVPFRDRIDYWLGWRGPTEL